MSEAVKSHSIIVFYIILNMRDENEKVNNIKNFGMNLIGYDGHYKFLLTKEQIHSIGFVLFNCINMIIGGIGSDQLKDKYIN